MFLYISLFVYGLTTFISPCSLGLVSAYLTYTIKDTQTKKRGLFIGLSYMLAMSLVFFIFGYALSSLIPVSLASSKLFYIFAGLIMVLLGLNTLEVLDRFESLRGVTGFFSNGSNIVRSSLMSRIGGKNDYIGAFGFGLIISVALGPCSLALVLPAVMMTLFSAPSAIHGGLQLLAFGVGHSLPVLVLSLLISQTRYLLSKQLVKAGGLLNYVIGSGLLLLGIWLIAEAL